MSRNELEQRIEVLEQKIELQRELIERLGLVAHGHQNVIELFAGLLQVPIREIKPAEAKPLTAAVN
jgi:uncharacterized coiled-coil protein SlyX